ncbi:MAG: hypothetical protein ACXVA9_00795 [Bdellovibrionales bacterium]
MGMKALLIILLSGFCLHASAESAKCGAIISKMEQVKDKALALNMKSDKSAREDASDAALATIDDFDKLKRSDTCRPKAWKAFVALAQAQAPFDGESQAAEMIDKRMSADALLRAPFTEATAPQSFPDRCRSELLTSSVSLAQCVRTHGGEKIANSVYEKCNMDFTFDYEKCVESKK